MVNYGLSYNKLFIFCACCCPKLFALATNHRLINKILLVCFPVGRKLTFQKQIFQMIPRCRRNIFGNNSFSITFKIINTIRRFVKKAKYCSTQSCRHLIQYASYNPKSHEVVYKQPVPDNLPFWLLFRSRAVCNLHSVGSNSGMSWWVATLVSSSKAPIIASLHLGVQMGTCESWE